MKKQIEECDEFVGEEEFLKRCLEARARERSSSCTTVLSVPEGNTPGHYHVRMDKPDFQGDKHGALGVVEKDFRSLNNLLGWMQKEYGQWAIYWQIDGLGGAEDDARKLLPQLQQAVEENWQWVYMVLNESSPDYQKCDTYCFTIARRDGEPANGFSFTEGDEVALTTTTSNIDNCFVDLYKDPIDANQISSFVPICDSDKGVFAGMTIMLKDGGRFLLVAGINQEEEDFNLGVDPVEKSMIKEILPSIPDGKMLHGFIIRLTNGDSLYLTIGKLMPAQKNPISGGKRYQTK